MTIGTRYFFEQPGRAPIELGDGEAIIGRSRAAAIQLADTTVSRQHATLKIGGGAVRLKDLGSSNGTFVNGERVQGEVALASGDRILVGEAEITLRIVVPPPVEVDRTVHVDMGKVFAEAIERIEKKTPAAPAPPEIATPQSPAPAYSTQRFETGVPTTPPKPMPVVPPPPPPPPPPSMPPPRPVAVAPRPPSGPQPIPPPRAGAAAAVRAKDREPTGEILSSIREVELAPVPPPRKGVVPARASATPAGFWIRVAASLLDGLPLILLSIAVFFLPMSLALKSTLSQVVGLGYGLGLALVGWGKFGTTPGKRLLGLEVTLADGTGTGPGIGVAKAFVRWLGYLVSMLPLGAGFLMIAASPRKRALHDLIAGTQVVRRG